MVDRVIEVAVLLVLVIFEGVLEELVENAKRKRVLALRLFAVEQTALERNFQAAVAIDALAQHRLDGVGHGVKVHGHGVTRKSGLA